MATRDTELGGVKFPKGAFVDLVAGAANRDPEIFENPDKFDIFRKRIPNFAFARGPHICVGQHLARVEMTRALHAILDNLPNLRLDPDKPQAADPRRDHARAASHPCEVRSEIGRARSGSAPRQAARPW